MRTTAERFRIALRREGSKHASHARHQLANVRDYVSPTMPGMRGERVGVRALVADCSCGEAVYLGRDDLAAVRKQRRGPRVRRLRIRRPGIIPPWCRKAEATP